MIVRALRKHAHTGQLSPRRARAPRKTSSRPAAEHKCLHQLFFLFVWERAVRTHAHGGQRRRQTASRAAPLQMFHCALQNARIFFFTAIFGPRPGAADLYICGRRRGWCLSLAKRKRRRTVGLVSWEGTDRRDRGKGRVGREAFSARQKRVEPIAQKKYRKRTFLIEKTLLLWPPTGVRCKAPVAQRQNRKKKLSKKKVLFFFLFRRRQSRRRAIGRCVCRRKKKKRKFKS